MKTFLRLSVGLTLLTSLILSFGCAAIRSAPKLPRTTTDALADERGLVEKKDLDRYRTETNPEKRKTIRNEILDERVLEIDYRFKEFELHLWRQGIGAGIGTDWILLAIAGATATMGGEELKSILGAVSAGITGAKGSFDKNALLEKTMPALVAQMVAEREKIRLDIERGKLMSDSTYSLFAGMAHLRAFLRAGSILGAIEVTARDAGAKTSEASRDLLNLREGAYQKDSAGDQLRAFWKPDGTTINTANEGNLKAWMKANRLDIGPGSITMFLRTSEMADLRLKAVNDLITN